MISESKGRVGTSSGTSDMSSFDSLDAARKEFHQIFLESNGNEFDAVEFVKKPGKYHRFDIDRETIDRRLPQNSKPTKLSEPLYKLMQMFFNENMMPSALQAFYFDIGSLPLGLIHKRTLQDAIEMLEKISTMLKGTKTQNLREMLAASNQFYSYFPQNFGLRRVPLINSLQTIKELSGMMRNVLNILEKYNLFAMKSAEEENLMDVCYGHLKHFAGIRTLNKSTEMYAEIVKYVKNSQTYNNVTNLPEHYLTTMLRFYEVDEIFEVTRHEDEIRYQTFESDFNRRLLFHGTPIRNILGILTNGFKIKTFRPGGGLFGRGIYFADSLSSSMTYTDDDFVGESELFLLNEVAAGLADVRYGKDRSKLKENCDSLQANGQWYPHPFHVCPDGLKIPNGELNEQPEILDLRFNEFVIFNTARIKIKYIVKVKRGNRS